MTRYILLAALFASACNSSENSKNTSVDDTTTTNDTFIATTPIPLGGCYSWTANKDSATLKLTVERDSVTGTLINNFNEKDDNTGTLKGVIQDSLVVANYTFQSEGMQSVREVVFKIGDSSLLEGFGEVKLTGDTVKFKNPLQLQYAKGLHFKRVDCKE